MKHIILCVTGLLVCLLGGCDKKPVKPAAKQVSAEVPSLPPVGREIPANEIPIWSRVADAYQAGPQALDALSKEIETAEPVNKDGRWNAILMAQWFAAAPEHFDMAVEQAKMLAKLEAWKALAPGKAAPRVAIAQMHLALGWKIRGHDYAAKVSDEAMAGFKHHVSLAVEAIDGAAGTNADPAWHDTALELARVAGANREAFDTSAADAVRLFPRCPHLSGSIIMYLAPRWYGKKGEWEPYIRKLARTAAGENADMFYAMAIVEAYRDCLVSASLVEEMLDPVEVDPAMLDRGFKQIAASYPESTFYASAEACIRGFKLNDPDGALAAFIRTKGSVDLRFWPSRACHDEIRTWVQRRTGCK